MQIQARRRSAPVRYGIALALFAAATLVRYWLQPVLGGQAPFFTYFVAAITATWFCGLLEGVMLIVAGAGMVNYLFLPRVVASGVAGANVAGVALGATIASCTVFLVHSLRRAQISAQDLRARFEQTLASIGDGVIATDESGRVQLLNRTAEELTGWAQAEAHGRALNEVFHIASEKSGATLATRQGAILPIEETGTPIRDANGKTIGAVVVFRDVTQRKAAQKQITESEERFRTMADAAPVMIWCSGLDKACDYFNRPWLEFTGRTLEQELDNGWAQGVHPGDLQACMSTYESSFDAHQVFQMIYRLRRHDGEYRWVLDRGAPRFHGKGEFAGYIGSCLDITDMVRAREEVEELLERLKLSQKAGSIGSFDCTQSGGRIVCRFSEEMERIHGVEPGGLKDSLESWAEFFHEGDRPRLTSEIENVMRTGGPWEGEFCVSRPDGLIRDVLVRGNVVSDNNGKPRLAGIMQDVTDQKRTQAALRNAIRALTSSNEDLRQFVYAASHDLQEPLRMVATYTQLLESRYHGQLDETAQEFIHNAVDGAVRMQRLLAALLDYSRADKLVEEPPAPVSCESAVSAAIENLKAAIDESQAKVVYDRLPVVVAHEPLVIGLFQNLIGNAVKYRGEEPPEIRVSAEHRGPEWIFAVSDNGIGIEEQYHKRIFDIFKRLHGQKYPGTGIGLAICSKVVESYGGRIWVESEAGKGATFFFTLPVYEVKAWARN